MPELSTPTRFKPNLELLGLLSEPTIRPRRTHLLIKPRCKSSTHGPKPRQNSSRRLSRRGKLRRPLPSKPRDLRLVRKIRQREPPLMPNSSKVLRTLSRLLKTSLMRKRDKVTTCQETLTKKRMMSDRYHFDNIIIITRPMNLIRR